MTGAGATLVLAGHLRAERRAPGVVLAVDPADAIASAGSARWALDALAEALSSAGYTVRRADRVDDASTSEICVLAAGSRTSAVGAALAQARAVGPDVPESLALAATRISGRRTILAAGADARGLVYALLDLADRVRAGASLDALFAIERPIIERPANPVRSVMRQFTSEALDKPWFYDRAAWPRYLAMLASHRFNRLHLAFGLGYDSLQQVTDSYLLFLYPFLLAVPGYDVHVTNLPDAERDRNFDTLRFVSEQTVAHGLDFQLGVWMHGYQLANSPRARYLVEGLTPETHAAYCRDALTAVLRACPAISSVGLRIHGESGIAEGSYDFWTTIFDGVKNAGRAIEIDLHAKGIDETMIANAVATGLPVNVSPKYWAEHLGMPYHQAAIRDLERPVAGRTGAGLMTLSEGARVFTRYGYADLLRDDRKYTVRHRVFSGTQRLLLSGDPETGAAYARMFQFCGSTGADLMEPLTCRGRRGSGGSSTRLGYIDASLAPQWDWEKYSYWYRTWGRLTYNPDTTADVFRREFASDPAPSALASAIASASRILPIVTTAYLPSAACDAYWPEIYWNQPMVEEPRPDPYGDTPTPKTFPHASPLDPQMFSRMSDFVEERLAGDRSGRYSPIDVAQWLEDFASSAARDLDRAGHGTSPARRRAEIDVQILVRLGQFFAAKLRAGVLYAAYEQTSDVRALDAALAQYRRARSAWAGLADRAKGVYADDLSVSDRFDERGAWGDRLAGIDADLARMGARRSNATTSDHPRAAAVVAEALARPDRIAAVYVHTPPAGFEPGAPVAIAIAVEPPRRPDVATLYYRHVNQAERFQTVAMTMSAGRYRAEIPAAYTDSPYPLQYYVEFKEGPDRAWLFPGFAANLIGLPYVVLRRRLSAGARAR